MIPFLILAVAVLLSAVLTRRVRDFANAREWNAVPSSDRHMHSGRIPRLGGVAIFVTLWTIVLFAWAGNHFAVLESVLGSVSASLMFKILGPATIIFIVGLIDDFRGLSPHVKFVAQAAAAVLLYCNGLGISRLSLLAGRADLGMLIGLPLTILWVLWITNAFNLIDGLDGLAAGAALFSTMVTAVAAICFHNQGILFLTVVLAGSIAGFLRYNSNPASIFLGDCGSLFIGFLLSAIALAGSQKAPTVTAVAIPIVSLGLPILDVAVAIVRRFLNCKGLFQADREHIHHKLISRGISHRQAVLVLYGVSACFGLLSLFLLHPAGAVIFTVFMALGIGVFLGIRQLHYLEFLELGRVATRALKQRHVIANDLNFRRAPEALQSCTSLSQFCQTMQQCLEPAGFDGFGLYLSSELPKFAVNPAVKTLKDSGPKLHFFWGRSPKQPNTKWSLSLSLLKTDGEPLGTFVLYRKNVSSPLLMDVEILTASEFCDSLAACVDKMRASWFAEHSKERGPAAGPGVAGTVIATRVLTVAEVSGSG